MDEENRAPDSCGSMPTYTIVPDYQSCWSGHGRLFETRFILEATDLKTHRWRRGREPEAGRPPKAGDIGRLRACVFLTFGDVLSVCSESLLVLVTAAKGIIRGRHLGRQALDRVQMAHEESYWS